MRNYSSKILIFSVILLGCGQANQTDKSSPDRTVGGEKHILSCDCYNDSLLGESSDYSLPLTVKDNDSGYINVRSTNETFENTIRGNIICQIPSKTTLMGYGPVKDKEVGSGFYYVVLLTDKNGKKCRGYIAKHLLHEGK